MDSIHRVADEGFLLHSYSWSDWREIGVRNKYLLIFYQCWIFLWQGSWELRDQLPHDHHHHFLQQPVFRPESDYPGELLLYHPSQIQKCILVCWYPLLVTLCNCFHITFFTCSPQLRKVHCVCESQSLQLCTVKQQWYGHFPLLCFRWSILNDLLLYWLSTSYSFSAMFSHLHFIFINFITVENKYMS